MLVLSDGGLYVNSAQVANTLDNLIATGLIPPLVAVMFFTVSGGPFGLEGLVGSVGPGVALLLLVATPLIYSIPETLLIGELASMLPVEGGYYQWVKRAFGRFWGFWNGWLSWTYSLLDMAIYPVLFIQYLRFFAPGLSQLEAWLVALALIWGATWLNLRGTVVVGTASGWFVATVLLPFGVLAGVAIARWIGQPATPLPVTPRRCPPGRAWCSTCTCATPAERRRERRRRCGCAPHLPRFRPLRYSTVSFAS